MEKTSAKGWTDTEKAQLYFAVINQACGKIDWNQLGLPAGRTIKACQVMLDKERQKVKKALNTETGTTENAGDNNHNNEAVEDTPKATKKRKSPEKNTPKSNKKARGGAKSVDEDGDDEEEIKSEEE